MKDKMKANGNNGVEAKRKYWQSLEERTAPEVASWQLPEFPGTVDEMKAEAKKSGYSRKDFLKFMGAGAVMFSAACRRPTEQIVPAVIQPPEYLTGIPSFYSSTAPDGTGLIVRTREGRPIKIAGNPDHPLSRGGVSSWNVASLYDLYDPDRQRKPARLSRGRKKRASESELVDEAMGKISEGSYVLLTGPVDSPSTRSAINAFLKSNSGGRHVEIRQDPTLRQIAAGQKVCYGQELVPHYNFEKAKLVVSIEGDFMGTMPGAPYYASSFGGRRDLRTGKKSMNRLVAFESIFSLTGSNADLRQPIRPGDATAIALSLAAHIVVERGNSKYAGNGEVRGLLSNYVPAKAASKLNVDGKMIEEVAEELWKNRGSSLVIGGSPLAASGKNESLAVAVNLLNSILDNDGKTVDYKNPLQFSAGSSDREVAKLVGDMKAGKVKTLIVAGANPVYMLPGSLKVSEALEKVDYILSLNDRVDETGALAHAILPSSHYLESWGDAEMYSGVYSVQQPVIRPLYQTLSLEDRLIQLNGGSLAGFSSFHEMLKDRWKKIQSSSGKGGSFTGFWQSALQAGHFAPGAKRLKETSGARNFNTGALTRLPRSLKSAGTKLGMYYNVQVMDGTGANNAYRQELPEPVTKIVWENYACMLPATARKLNLKQGTIVEVATSEGSLYLPLLLIPGIHPDAVLVSLGYGREAAGRIANKRGVNAMNVARVSSDSFVLSGMDVTEIRNTGDRHILASTQMVYRTGFNSENRAFFAPGSMPDAPYNGSSQYDRPIVLETTLEHFKKDPTHFTPEKAEYPRNAAVMTSWDYNHIRWHMAIDLTLCNGCGACVTSCNIENNIPMVGPEQVSIGREMHWLRIDRYFSGSEENPEVAHQPMLCQHCENAPCENVCPVAATQHNSEGINVMAYNRCIGTRYCANNCPYKVRRFNWFENWNYMEGFRQKLHDPQQLGFNPDVTVRSRGVIEKCSFCLHRISNARREMRARGDEKMMDGTVVTACQEVCPTKAISFGDINDKTSEVAKLVKRETRGYKVLDFLAVNPSVTYLAKVRNKA